MTALDIDNDDRDDLTIASSNAGTLLFYGGLPQFTDGNGTSRDCRSNDADATFTSTQIGVANAGDQNEDGYEDLLIRGYGSNNHIHLFYGADNGP